MSNELPHFGFDWWAVYWHCGKTCMEFAVFHWDVKKRSFFEYLISKVNEMWFFFKRCSRCGKFPYHLSFQKEREALNARKPYSLKNESSITPLVDPSISTDHIMFDQLDNHIKPVPPARNLPRSTRFIFVFKISADLYVTAVYLFCRVIFVERGWVF